MPLIEYVKHRPYGTLVVLTLVVVYLADLAITAFSLGKFRGKLSLQVQGFITKHTLVPTQEQIQHLIDGKTLVRPTRKGWARIAHGAFSLLQVALHLNRPPKPMIKHRAALCGACPHRIGIECTKCGCIAAAKACLRDQFCPVGHWHEYGVNPPLPPPELVFEANAPAQSRTSATLAELAVNDPGKSGVTVTELVVRSQKNFYEGGIEVVMRGDLPLRDVLVDLRKSKVKLPPDLGIQVDIEYKNDGPRVAIPS